MVNLNQIYSALSFWDIQNNQDYLKYRYAQNIDWPNIIAPGLNYLPNFQFNVDSDFSNITSFKLINAKDTSQITELNTSLLSVEVLNQDRKLIKYYNSQLSNNMECGLYKLQITDGVKVWESEIFEVYNDLDSSSIESGNSFNDDFNISFDV